MTDTNGHKLTAKEMRLEMDEYNKANISFLCCHCRMAIGTNSYKEFLQRIDRNICRYPDCVNYSKDAKGYCCNGCSFDDFDRVRLLREAHEKRKEESKRLGKKKVL